MTSKANPHHPTNRRSERTSRFLRAHNPLQPPKLRVWHVLLGLILIGFFAACVIASGVAGELGRMTLKDDWRITVLWIEGIAVLCLVALVAVRAMSPLMYVGLSLQVVALGFWLGISVTERLPFTLINGVLLLVLTLIPVRVITRPNEQDQLVQTRQERDDALADNAHLRAKLARYEGDS
ncbi:hypothetical protein [Deinococcus sp. QL22]|uniref:hypothetical protein n=1 Tax=Deinococcus sp. QL22 TaxID=2939437 RepID=UPI0020177B0B|nr:hypothetical protein [Deinococcus sp. QL22]UQN06265.1 hypothetical protein M1R55_15615 [Deinococcus sp. QL22]